MKTKNKTLALLEIAIVLCSVFLVALPAIAAANEKTYEHTDLDVFGNANEDDTIDMRDTTYIKLAIFGKKPKTDLADANYDGKVSMLDIGQTKLIILGKEKELTFIDIFGEAVKVNKPIKRLAQLGGEGPRITRALGARDLIVAIASTSMKEKKTFYPVISKLPIVGNNPAEVDYETLLELEVDAVQTNLEANFALGKLEDKRLFEEKLHGIPIICLNMREIDPETLSRNVRTYGYILDKEAEAEEFVAWNVKQYDMIYDRTKDIPIDKKMRAYFQWGGPNYAYSTKSSNDRCGQVITLAGGLNIADEIPGMPNSATVDPEWLIENDPEIVILCGCYGMTDHYVFGYETDDPSVHAATVQYFIDTPGLQDLTAVNNEEVYLIDAAIMHGGTMVGAVCVAKLFYPDLFEDIDPDVAHQEYVDKFCYIDFDVKEHGVFVYPPMEEWPSSR